MKVITDMSLENFKPWCGATYAHKIIIERKAQEEFETIIEDLFPDGIEETTLNDFLWFDDQYIFELLGFIDLLEE